MTTTTIAANLITRVAKGRDGWTARTELDLPGLSKPADIGMGDRPVIGLLTIATSKGRNELSSRATIGFKGDGFVTHRMFTDYSQPVASSASRCTEKAIRELHAKALDKLPDILASVAAHYGTTVERMQRQPVPTVNASEGVGAMLDAIDKGRGILRLNLNG